MNLYNKQDSTALHNAIQNNYEKWHVEMLLQQAINIEAENAEGLTSLELAIKESNTTAIKALMEYNACITCRIQTAIQNKEIKNIQILRLLVFKIIEAFPSLIQAILEQLHHQKALNNKLYCMQLLYTSACAGTIQKVLELPHLLPEALINQDDKNEKTVLHLLIEIFSDLKKDLNQSRYMPEKYQFLTYKIQNIKNSIKFLIAAGSDINKPCSKGVTAHQLLTNLGEDGREILGLFKKIVQEFSKSPFLNDPYRKNGPTISDKSIDLKLFR